MTRAAMIVVKCPLTQSFPGFLAFVVTLRLTDLIDLDSNSWMTYCSFQSISRVIVHLHFGNMVA